MIKRAAFTLIELLVVVSIIALLIAVLLPALTQARTRSKELVCAADLRALTQVTIMYANEYRGSLPDLGLKPGTNTAASQLYYTFIEWRKLFENKYGIRRNHWYSPNNPSWSGDDLYYWPTGVPSTSTDIVMGRFYFTSTKGNGRDVATSYMFNGLVDPLPVGEWPLFAQKLSDKPHWSIVWTDLNREYPSTPGYIDWSTPGANRIGANHLYGDIHDIPAGSHESHLDGSVEWVSGSDFKVRARPGNEIEAWW